MNRPIAAITFSEPARAPVVRPSQASASVQAERKRLADLKRARKAALLSKRMA